MNCNTCLKLYKHYFPRNSWWLSNFYNVAGLHNMVFSINLLFSSDDPSLFETLFYPRHSTLGGVWIDIGHFHLNLLKLGHNRLAALPAGDPLEMLHRRRMLPPPLRSENPLEPARDVDRNENVCKGEAVADEKFLVLDGRLVLVEEHERGGLARVDGGLVV